MNTIHKYFLKFKTQIFYFFGTVICLLGLYIAHLTVESYKHIVDCVLGLVTVLLIYIVLFSQKRIINSSPREEFELPKDLWLFVIIFFMAIITYWAVTQIINLGWYILDSFK